MRILISLYISYVFPDGYCVHIECMFRRKLCSFDAATFHKLIILSSSILALLHSSVPHILYSSHAHHIYQNYPISDCAPFPWNYSSYMSLFVSSFGWSVN